MHFNMSIGLNFNYVYICMTVYLGIWVLMNVYIYMCVYIAICLWSVYLCAHTCVCLCAHMYVLVFTHMCVSTGVCLCACRCMYVLVYNLIPLLYIVEYPISMIIAMIHTFYIYIDIGWLLYSIIIIAHIQVEL